MILFCSQEKWQACDLFCCEKRSSCVLEDMRSGQFDSSSEDDDVGEEEEMPLDISWSAFKLSLFFSIHGLILTVIFKLFVHSDSHFVDSYFISSGCPSLFLFHFPENIFLTSFCYHFQICILFYCSPPPFMLLILGFILILFLLVICPILLSFISFVYLMSYF